MSGELPYKTEYAKSGRAGCKGCKQNIGQGTLRLAVMVQVLPQFFNIFINRKKLKSIQNSKMDCFIFRSDFTKLDQFSGII